MFAKGFGGSGGGCLGGEVIPHHRLPLPPPLDWLRVGRFNLDINFVVNELGIRVGVHSPETDKRTSNQLQTQREREIN